MFRQTVAVTLFAGLISGTCIYAQITVTNTRPLNAEINVPDMAAILVELDGPIDQMAVVVSAPLTIRGLRSGLYPGAYRFPNPSTVAFDSAVPFLSGEPIEVTVTHDLVDTNGAPVTPYTFQFCVEAEGCDVTFTNTQSLDAFNSWQVSLGDLDGDGDLDAFIANGNVNPNTVWSNAGSGLFTDTGQRMGNSKSKSLALGDLDGDGDLDAFIANVSGQANEVWINNGSSVFTNSGQTLGSGASRGVRLGDMNSDGHMDAFVANGAVPGEANTCWFNDGSGLFTDSGQSLGNLRSRHVEAGGLDGDGDLDLFFANADAAGNMNTVWTNDGLAGFPDSGLVLGNAQVWTLCSGTWMGMG